MPMMTIKFAASKLQAYSEHVLYQKPILQKGHTIAATAAVRFFLFPLNSHLHVVHHLEPATPWFLLPKRSQRYSSWDRINGVFGEGGLLQRLMT
jgi:fatty acid desaturase